MMLGFSGFASCLSSPLAMVRSHARPVCLASRFCPVWPVSFPLPISPLPRSPSLARCFFARPFSKPLADLVTRGLLSFALQLFPLSLVSFAPGCSSGPHLQPWPSFLVYFSLTPFTIHAPSLLGSPPAPLGRVRLCLGARLLARPLQPCATSPSTCLVSALRARPPFCSFLALALSTALLLSARVQAALPRVPPYLLACPASCTLFFLPCASLWLRFLVLLCPALCLLCGFLFFSRALAPRLGLLAPLLPATLQLGPATLWRPPICTPLPHLSLLPFFRFLSLLPCPFLSPLPSSPPFGL